MDQSTVKVMIAKLLPLPYSNFVESYQNSLEINAPVATIYAALSTIEGLTSWWTTRVESEGRRLTFYFDLGMYAVMQVEKMIPNELVAWRCSEQNFKTPGTDITNEWVGTVVWFRLSKISETAIKLEFMHEGLVPKLFCYKDCENGWNFYLESLKKYAETGKGTPFSAPAK